ncbi:putative aminotransferase TAT1 [Capsicum annuum]|nr:putative aminotransferase TAT1 [Capsicum annuum]
MELSSNWRWKFEGSEVAKKASAFTIRSYLNPLRETIDKSDITKSVIPLSHGDPSGFPSFRTTKLSEDALLDALQSAKYNGYPDPQTCYILQATRAVAEYLSHDYPHELSANDVLMTAGAKQAIDVLITALAVPGANILLPRPGYPTYEAIATFTHLEMRHYDLLPEQDWEVDIDGVEALADDRTVAIVVINPGNPCGNVYKREHLKKIAEAARKVGMLVISDEAYAHLVFGSNPFVPMGVFGEISPILTIGSISKKWMVPGWRLGWIAMCDPNGILQKHGTNMVDTSGQDSPINFCLWTLALHHSAFPLYFISCYTVPLQHLSADSMRWSTLKEQMRNCVIFLSTRCTCHVINNAPTK